ncbi:MAG: glycogen/starch synthase [Rikenellaceae bacterium]
MEQKSKILYLCQQVDPYVAESSRAVLSRELMQGVHEQGYEIRTFMPRYGVINERRNQLHEVIRLSGMNIIIGDTDHQLIIKVATIPSARLQIYFIDNDDYFSRKALLRDDNGEEFEDNDERAIFFARGVLETVKKLRWEPAIVHAHGWFSALVAAYLRHSFAEDPIFAEVKIVVSLDDDTFENRLDAELAEKLRSEGIDSEMIEKMVDPTYENFVRFVLSYADGVVISADSVSDEVLQIARECGKPLLEYQKPSAENYFENYAKFYDGLL